MMIVVNCEQGSPGWFQEKLGKVSASECSKIITSDGKTSKQRDGYLYELAAEIVTGTKTSGYSNGNMEEGNIREQESRDMFCLINDCDIERVGVVYKDDSRRVLCSPDGMIRSRTEGIECKNPLPKTQVKYLLDGGVPSEYFAQVQFSLWVTGFKVWHFFSYSPLLKTHHVIVEPDIEYHKHLDAAVPKFIKELDEIVERIR